MLGFSGLLPLPLHHVGICAALLVSGSFAILLRSSCGIRALPTRKHVVFFQLVVRGARFLYIPQCLEPNFTLTVPPQTAMLDKIPTPPGSKSPSFVSECGGKTVEVVRPSPVSTGVVFFNFVLTRIPYSTSSIYLTSPSASMKQSSTRLPPRLCLPALHTMQEWNGEYHSTACWAA